MIAADLATRLDGRIPNMDLTPLGAQLDELFGGKSGMQSAASVVASGAEEQRRIDQGIDRLMGGKLVSGKNPLLSASLLRAGQQADENQRKEKASDRRFDLSIMESKDKLEKEIQEKFNKDLITPLIERSQQFKTIETALAKGDINQIGMILGQFARGISGEKGVLTDRDIARVFPDTASQMISRWQAFITGNGPADPKIIEKAKDLVEAARSNANNVYGEVAQTTSNQFKNRSKAKEFGLDPYIQEQVKESKRLLNSFAVKKSQQQQENPSSLLQKLQAIKQKKEAVK
jgi:hypothetical protein